MVRPNEHGTSVLADEFFGSRESFLVLGLAMGVVAMATAGVVLLYAWAYQLWQET